MENIFRIQQNVCKGFVSSVKWYCGGSNIYCVVIYLLLRTYPVRNQSNLKQAACEVFEVQCPNRYVLKPVSCVVLIKVNFLNLKFSGFFDVFMWFCAGLSYFFYIILFMKSFANFFKTAKIISRKIAIANCYIANQNYITIITLLLLLLFLWLSMLLF